MIESLLFFTNTKASDLISSLKHTFKVVFLRPQRVIQCLKNAILDLRYGGKYLGVPINNTDATRGYANTTSTEYDTCEIITNTEHKF